MWLRQSTASQEVLLGPFLDSTDGNTAETGLTIANTDIKLWKEGATTEANKNSGGATHIAGGRYYAVLDATDTATLGKLEVNVHVAGALAVRREFMVVPAMVYDSLILGTDRFDANVTHVADTAQTANDNGADINAILVDTNELQTDWVNGGRLDLILDTVAADTTTDIPALIATAQADLDIITGANGAVLAATQPNSLSFQPITITAGDAINNITLAGTGTSDGIAFTRTGSGDPFDANFIGQINATVDTALTDYDAATGTEAAAIKADTAAILVDTAEIGAAGAGLTEAGGTGDQLTAVPWNAAWDVEVQSECADALTAYGASTVTTAQVNAEVADVLKTDTISEMAQGAPTATPTFEEAVMYLYQALRNKVDVTATTKEFHNDAGTVIWKKALSDDGTTYSEAEGVSGP